MRKYLLTLLYELTGSCVYCPCCDSVLREFATHGIKPRPNAICLKCRALERHRMLWLYLKNDTDLFVSDTKLLHIAPEHIFDTLFRSSPNIDYLSADLQSELAMLKMDLTDMSFDDDSFDMIICSHVLEHIPDDGKAMSELQRVLRPGGTAIILVPVLRETTYEDPSITDPEERLRAFGQSDHVRIYGKDITTRLSTAGFGVGVLECNKHFSEHDIRRYGLRRNHIMYLCTK